MNWDYVRIFKCVAENGSMRKAASELKISHSTLSRQIEKLEKDLRTKLFYRLNSGLALTESGANLLSASLPMQIEFDRIEREIIGHDHTIDGEIKITLPGILASHILFSEFLHFQEQWPQIKLQIHTSDNVLNLSNGDADIAIRLTSEPDDLLIGRKIGDIYQAAYASKKYVRTLNENDQSDIKWVKPGSLMNIKQTQLDSELSKVHECELIVNHIDLQVQAIEMNRGVALLPCFIADKNESLSRISKPYQHLSIWILYTKELRENKRMMLFRQFIIERIRDYSDLLEGKTKSLYRNASTSKLHDHA